MGFQDGQGPNHYHNHDPSPDHSHDHIMGQGPYHGPLPPLPVPHNHPPDIHHPLNFHIDHKL